MTGQDAAKRAEDEMSAADKAAKDWLDTWGLRWDAEGGTVHMPPGSGSALAEVHLGMQIQKAIDAAVAEAVKEQNEKIATLNESNMALRDLLSTANEAVKERDAEIAGLTHTLALWEHECGGLGPRAFVAEARREERAKVKRLVSKWHNGTLTDVEFRDALLAVCRPPASAPEGETR